MKSYFNVPDHINTNNRHLGIEKNVRKNKYEPKAKKKHRVARLKFLNNKRNLEIFQMSLNATYEHIELVNQYYYNLRILEEDNIIEKVNSHTAKYMSKKWRALGEHPLVGEARIKGLMGALELTPDKSSKSPFTDSGHAGTITRNICLNH